MVNQVEEITEAILNAMEEFAPVYELDLSYVPPKEYMAHVVASLINDGVIVKKEKNDGQPGEDQLHR